MRSSISSAICSALPDAHSIFRKVCELFLRNARRSSRAAELFSRSMRMNRDAFIIDAVRTPIGRYGGVLSQVRPDDLAAAPIKALVERNANIDFGSIDDVYFGCANQAGEDNRNVAR